MEDDASERGKTGLHSEDVLVQETVIYSQTQANKGDKRGQIALASGWFVVHSASVSFVTNKALSI
jgi:hypothetical protein